MSYLSVMIGKFIALLKKKKEILIEIKLSFLSNHPTYIVLCMLRRNKILNLYLRFCFSCFILLFLNQKLLVYHNNR